GEGSRVRSGPGAILIRESGPSFYLFISRFCMRPPRFYVNFKFYGGDTSRLFLSRECTSS
ncbi:unnamed protein product, partial [Musa acuminata var. zebrina]